MKQFKIISLTLAACSQLAFGLTAAAADQTVTTVKEWVGGATTLYGRMTTAGFASTPVSRQGFCYATQPMPTVNDQVATDYIDNNGRIYKMTGLTPATVYYIRAFAETKAGDVIYGQPVKAVTRPQVNGVNYTIRDGFPDEALNRIKPAAAKAAELWNEYTGIRGLNVSIGYGAQTPTADCSYGGWMRVGPNASYQATGTLLHEMLHAIGVGTVYLWYGPDSYLRQNGSSGYWLGPRATRVVRFWDNDKTAYLKGDKTHMWPYGVNGAHEDTKTDKLYIGNSLLAEALGEDGLPTTTSQFAIPAYVFEQEDTVKYYIKSESEDNGLYTSCLTVSKDGKLAWRQMDCSQALANDSAAWNITFNPATCLYSLKNVATGKYISYKSVGNDGFVTKTLSEPGETESLHFLPSSVEVQDIDVKGYWISYVKNNQATSLTAVANQKTSAASMKFEKNAQSQRWLIQNGDELAILDAQLKEALNKRNTTARSKVDSVIAQGKRLLDVPHVENKEGTDQTLTESLTSIKAKVDTLTVEADIVALETEAKNALFAFLENVTPKSVSQPFDVTFLMANPGLDSSEGWSESPTLSFSCGEFFEKTFNMIQKVKLPKGTFKACVQAFQRPGASADVYQDFLAGNDKVTATFTAQSQTVKLKNIMADAQPKTLGGKELAVASGTYIPNNMQAASLYFAKGLYENEVVFSIRRSANVNVALANTSIVDNDWTIFSNFRMFYYGTLTKDEVTGINTVVSEATAAPSVSGIYGFNGVLISKDASAVDRLPAGLYIINGKKVIIK